MLSDTKIKSLKPKEKMYRLLDAERLYIEIRPSGKKIWRFKYTMHGKEGTLSLGEYPLVSLSEARKKKDEVKVLIKNGINPTQDKKNKILETKVAIANTFKALAEEYIVEQMQYKTDDYIDQFKRYMRLDIYPLIGHKPIAQITSADVLFVMKSTVKRIQKTGRFGTGEVAANMNRRFIGLVIKYAIMTMRAENDPTQVLKHVINEPDTEHARHLTSKEQIQLRTMLQLYGGTTTVKNACLALMYTMLRASEIRRMEWSFVDFENNIIEFPKASRRRQQERTNKKNHIHIVPISSQLLSILKEQQEVSQGKTYVFPAPNKKDDMLARTTFNRALVCIGLPEVTTHDFRATASTLLNEKGYDRDWIEKQLAHTPMDKTRASYNHAQYLDDRRKMLQDWADIVDSWNKYDE